MVMHSRQQHMEQAAAPWPHTYFVRRFSEQHGEVTRQPSIRSTTAFGMKVLQLHYRCLQVLLTHVKTPVVAKVLVQVICIQELLEGFSWVGSANSFISVMRAHLLSGITPALVCIYSLLTVRS